MGFVSEVEEAERVGSLHDTRDRAGSAKGHDFGSGLSEDERWQLVEYLKTL